MLKSLVDASKKPSEATPATSPRLEPGCPLRVGRVVPSLGKSALADEILAGLAKDGRGRSRRMPSS